MLVIVISLCLFLVCTQAVAADGRILFLKGKASINAKIIKKSAKINYGDTFKTGPKSVAILSIDPGTTLKLKEGSTVTIEKPKILKSSIIYTYLLKKGEIFVEAYKKKNTNYQVRSKHAVMGVRGTVFFVSTLKGEKANIWMCVNEGAVEVSLDNNPNSVLVKEGEGVQINSPDLPKVKKYKWTKDLNWKMSGNFDEVNDTTDIQSKNYDFEKFQYD